MPKFGDVIINKWAGKENPTRIGVFVRQVRKNCYLLTDMSGEIWEQWAEDSEKVYPSDLNVVRDDCKDFNYLLKEWDRHMEDQS